MIYNKILDVAETLIQQQGFNAFSYKDISSQVGIKTSSIHYHFPTKNELAKCVVKRQLALIEENLMALSQKKCDPRKKIIAFLDQVFMMTFENGRKMCLGGMLASDALILDEIILSEVKRFFDVLENWLAIQFNEIKSNNQLIYNEDPKILARLVMSMLEGALLLSRLFNHKTRLEEVKILVKSLLKL